MPLVLASANPDKAAEIAALLQPVPGLVLLPRPGSVPDVDETGKTLLDNARLKARALVDATGEAAVADDTGLEVEGLDGAPGVFTARFAGEHATYADNVAKLSAELSAVGADQPDRAEGDIPYGGPGGVSGWERALGGRPGVGGHHPPFDRQRGLRLRPRLRPRRMWWPVLCPDVSR